VAFKVGATPAQLARRARASADGRVQEGGRHRELRTRLPFTRQSLGIAFSRGVGFGLAARHLRQLVRGAGQVSGRNQSTVHGKPSTRPAPPRESS
jgi:hypothetical protein